MPDTKISADPTASTLTGAELLPVLQGGLNKKATIQAVISDRLLVRAFLNGDGSYSLQLPDDSFLQSVSPVYALPGVTISGVTTLPAANTFATGSVVRLHKDNFIGAGANPIGAEIWADAGNNVWRPHGRQRLFENTGTLALPLSTLTTAGTFTIGLNPIIPGGLGNATSKFIFTSKYRKLGATTTQVVRTTLGTDMTVSANNSIVYTQTVGGAVSNRDIYAWSEVNFNTTTTAFTTNRSQVGAGGADSQFGDIGTLLNTAADMKVRFEASTLVGETIYLIGFGIYWDY